MRQYKRDEGTGKILVKEGLRGEWVDLEKYISDIRKEAKERSKTFKDKFKAKLIKKIKKM